MKQVQNLKRNNFIILISFFVLIAICLVIIGVRKHQEKPPIQGTTTFATQTQPIETTTTVPTTTTTIVTKEPVKQEGDSLFIGDSRTVGISEYAQIPNADFFCDVGMSVYNIDKKNLSVKNIGKLTLDQLLTQKQYAKIYIMLGINEVGYNMNTTVKKYQALLDRVLQKQPNALVFIQANLHVTKERSDKDDVVNNSNLNKLNEKIKTLADGKRIFYIDANPVFDDKEGNLGQDKTADNAHLYAKYYKQWGQWIIAESEKIN